MNSIHPAHDDCAPHLCLFAHAQAFAMHAKMQQRARLKNLDRFRSGKDGIIVCTDVASRGLDLPEVQLVVHYHLPMTSEVGFRVPPTPGRALTGSCRSPARHGDSPAPTPVRIARVPCVARTADLRSPQRSDGPRWPQRSQHCHRRPDRGQGLPHHVPVHQPPGGKLVIWDQIGGGVVVSRVRWIDRSHCVPCCRGVLHLAPIRAWRTTR